MSQFRKSILISDRILWEYLQEIAKREEARLGREIQPSTIAQLIMLGAIPPLKKDNFSTIQMKIITDIAEDCIEVPIMEESSSEQS